MFELDDDYVQFGQEDDDTTEVQEVQEVRVNSQGIKVRGKDMEWLPAGSFHSDDRYKDSEIYKNLKEHFTLKRKSDTQFGAVENYVCRVSRRAGYVKCPKQFRVIFPDDSQSVHVEETNGSHNHSRSEEVEKEDPHYRWSQLATQIITEGVINNLKPTVIRRNLRSHNALSDPEPSRIQLNNKISYIKRKGNLVEHCDTTLSLRNKLKDYLDIPDDENESWVPFCQIDDSEDSDEVRILVIFATNKILSYLKMSDTFHCDATYRLNWNGYPVFICGVTNQTGKFFPTFAVLSSHEDVENWKTVFQFVHSYAGGSHFKFFMGDGAKAITRAWSEVTFFHMKSNINF